MDKALFRAYVRELVNEEVKKILPKLLEEAVMEVKNIQENKMVATAQPKQKMDRAKLAELMGLERLDQETLVASTKNIGIPVQTNVPSDNPALQAINKDYSGIMKKMGLSK